MGNDREILGDKHGLAQALLSIVDGLAVIRLIDRDDRSKQEIEEAEQQGIRVLSRRNLESYLFDDEVLQALAMSEGKGSEIKKLLCKKQSILANRPDDPSDDLKRASGEIYVACKDILSLTPVRKQHKVVYARHTRTTHQARDERVRRTEARYL